MGSILFKLSVSIILRKESNMEVVKWYKAVDWEGFRYCAMHHIKRLVSQSSIHNVVQ